MNFMTEPGVRMIGAQGRAGEETRVALLIGIQENAPPPDEGTLDGIQEIADATAKVAGVIVERAALRRQTDDMARLHASALRLMLAPDKGTLLNSIADVVQHEFGFSRVYFSLFHPPTRSLRSELQRGFDASFAPIAIPLEPAEDFAEKELLKTLRSGIIRFYPQANTQASELKIFAGHGPLDKSALLPFKIGERLLGFIYADRPADDAPFCFPKLLEIFASLAATALENFALRADAEERALTDSLTGLYNRRYLDRVLEIETARVRRYKRPLSLMMIDLCDFKRINDTYGHVHGDEALRETAALIRHAVRQPDVVVRYGGDEFVVLLADTSYDHALRVQDRIERTFEERNRLIRNGAVRIEVSVGLSAADPATLHALLENADRAMYFQKTERAKRRAIEALMGLPSVPLHALDNVLLTLLAGLKKREPHYDRHSRHVAYLSLVASRGLGLSPSRIRALLLAAFLHDVGKVSLPGELLQRPGPLDAAEKQAMRIHPVIGEEFFQGVSFLEDARPIIRHHHERYDGRMDCEFPAYPKGLKGTDIPLEARILKLADSVDAMLSDRPYRPARPVEEVLRVVREESGASFDPRLADNLLTGQWHDRLDAPNALPELYSSVIREAEEAAAQCASASHAG